MKQGKGISDQTITYGVCYYPEQWPSDQWESDLIRIKNTGFDCIRIAEFCWHIFEPKENVFQFDLIDRFLDLVEKMDLCVIFGTPTAIPPVWMGVNYPEIFNHDMNGKQYRHGGRRHYNYNSPVYQSFCERIVSVLAEHYKKRKCIVAWQIDNEVNCEINEFYSPSDHYAFQAFLRRKYNTINELNTAWGTVFWNQTYNSFEEIDLPGQCPDYTDNPHQKLDYYRFISESARNHIKRQSRILRRILPSDTIITTNGYFENLDNYRMVCESLDVFSYDSYPDFAYEVQPDNTEFWGDRSYSLYLSEVRACSAPFWIMEQQSGGGGWTTCMLSAMPKPGQIRLWTVQSIAHGANLISYFRWRTARFGTEMYWNGILNSDGRDTRRLKEIREIISFTKRMEGITDSHFVPSFGVVEDYDNEWDAKTDIVHSELEHISREGIFVAAQKNHVPFDFVRLSDEVRIDDQLHIISEYPVLFYPHPMILTEKKKDVLEEYVRNGGTLILGARAGWKNTWGQCIEDIPPGILKNLTGATVEDFTLLTQQEEKKAIINGDTFELQPAYFLEQYVPSGKACVEAVHRNNYWNGKPAVIRHTFYKGTVYSFGSVFTEEATLAFLKKLKLVEPYENTFKMPEDCELAIRSDGHTCWWFVLNYADKLQKIKIMRELKDLDTGNMISGTVELPSYNCMIFSEVVGSEKSI